MSVNGKNGIGRPTSLEQRLAIFCDLLSANDISQAPSNLHALAWWDEVLAPLIGCAIETVGFVRSADGPRSAAVDEVVNRWTSAGLLTRSDAFDGEASLSLYADGMLCDTGRAERGSEWHQLLDMFLRGFHQTGKPCISPMQDVDDIRRVLLVDPVYNVDPWEAAGPGSVRSDLSSISLSLAGRRGNQAAGVVLYWMQLQMSNAHQGALIYALCLAERAAKTFPAFGDAVFLANVEALTVRETPVPAGDRVAVSAEFLKDGNVVAEVVFVPRIDKRIETTRKGKYGFTESDGEVLFLHVAEGHRRQGYGTLALRHAMSRGCMNAPPPPAGGERLWSLHGHRQPDGRYRLCRVKWPTCRDAEGAPATAAQPTL